MADLHAVFNEYADVQGNGGAPNMSEEAWVNFCEHFGLLESTEGVGYYNETGRCKWVFEQTTGDRLEEWMPYEFEQFMSGLSMIGPYRRLNSYAGNTEEQTNRNTFDEIVAWVTEREAKTVVSVEFKHIEKFSNDGGSAGS